MEAQRLPYACTTIQHNLTLDYLQNAEHLQAFYQYTPDEAGSQQALKERPQFPVDRELLTNTLLKQYRELGIDPDAEDENAPVLANIRALSAPNTFTVTTGHQLNILGGPLFYFYKIASTIHLAQRLSRLNPDQHVVPVYWMATEDHDFEEIKDVHLLGDTYTWEKDATGPVGEMDPAGLPELVARIQQDIREQEAFQPLAELWREAFTRFSSYGRACQYWVHQLFRQYGLVILDPNDEGLKQHMVSIFEADLQEQVHEQLVTSRQEALSGYALPVNPRPINIFFTQPGSRERIVPNNGGYELADQSQYFAHGELIRTLQQQPGLFSPNVVLRPLYQQVILPNLTYIGGTNEIAYWLELKKLFDHHQVFYPQLLVRNSALWVGKGLQKKARKYSLTYEDLFRSQDEVIKAYLAREADTQPFDDRINALQQEYEHLMSLCEHYDEEMKWPIINLAKEHLKALEKLQRDTRKLVKNRNEKDLQQIEKVISRLFPEGKFQERYENFIPYYTKYGDQFFDQLIQDCNPFEQSLLIYEE